SNREHSLSPFFQHRTARRCYGQLRHSFADRLSDPGSETPRSPLHVQSITGGQRNVDAFLRELLPDPLELLVVRNLDGTGVAEALELARRVIDVALHELC